MTEKSTEPRPTVALAPRLALSAAELAESLGMSARAIWTMTNQDKIPHVKIGGRTLYPIAAVAAWLSDNVKGGEE